jgi:hypothetical protein
MPRYVTKSPCAWIADDVWDAPVRPDIVVADHAPIDTGIIDAQGNAIFRLPNPIGFGRDEEW